MKRRWTLVVSLGAGLLLLLFISPSFAGAPEGHPDSLDSQIRYNLSRNLDYEGYMAHFTNGQDLQRGISAYLWDNRDWLKHTDFHNARNVDVVICLMLKKGYGGFEDYAQKTSFMSWCHEMVRE